MKRFVTFSINKVVGIIENTPHFERQKYVVECDDLTKAQEVAYDLNSVDGVQYIHINKTNKDKTRKVLSQKDYLKF